VTDRDIDGAERTAAAIRGTGAAAQAYEHDVADDASWEAMTAAVVRDAGGIDALVNNAGVTRDRSLLRMSREEWDTVIAVHLTGAWHGCRAVVPHMRERGGGAIVNLSSESRYGAFGQSNYAAAKAGIIGFTRTVAIEHARHAIRCNAVAPGSIDTPMTQAVPEEIRASWIDGIPLARFGEASEIASVIAFLVSDDASYVTGQVLGVDGGSTH
jgi:3-oxoacyl-[acyl-carrier protein] reductase